MTVSAAKATHSRSFPRGTYTATAVGSPDQITLGQTEAPTPLSRAQVLKLQAANAKTGVHDVKVIRRMPSQDGGWIELLRDPDPHFVQRNFAPFQHQTNPEIVKAFGTETPHSGDVLLHYAGDPPAGVPVDPTPLLLVHGAIKDGHFFWDPKEDGSGHGPAQTLRAQGRRVFAVTFAHNQDSTMFQAQQVMNAMARIKDLTHADQVDLDGHSKGGASVSVVAKPGLREPWMTPYQGDVRRLALTASPNGGIDYSFRHSAGNPVLAMMNNINAPMSWDRMGIGWFAVSYQDKGFSSEGKDYFPGQRELLNRWDKEFPLPTWEQDWYTTYHGGQGFVSHSEGIEAAMEDSGQFMRRMESTPFDPDVEVGILAGNRANIANIMNEFTGPSDGLLFVRSALKVPEGTRVVKEDVLPLNHKSLVSDPAGQKWLSDFLSADTLKPLSQKQQSEILRRGEATAA